MLYAKLFFLSSAFAVANAAPVKSANFFPSDALVPPLSQQNLTLAEGAGAPGGSSILIIGDSNANFALDTLKYFCKGSSVVNRAIPTTKATDWGFRDVGKTEEMSPACSMTQVKPPAGVYTGCVSHDVIDLVQPNRGGNCNVENYMNPAFGGPYTHVWLTVGGNDWFDGGCSPNLVVSTRKNIEKSIKAAKAGNPGAKIIVTGYVTPTAGLTSAYDCLGVTDAAGIATITKDAAKNAGAIFVDSNPVSRITPGDANSWGDGKYFCVQPTGAIDPIHTNLWGYCAQWSTPEFQSAFDCQAQTFNCAAYPAIHKMHTPVSGSMPNETPIGGVTTRAGGLIPGCVDSPPEQVKSAAADAGHTEINSCADVKALGGCSQPGAKGLCPLSCKSC